MTRVWSVLLACIIAVGVPLAAVDDAATAVLDEVGLYVDGLAADVDVTSNRARYDLRSPYRTTEGTTLRLNLKPRGWLSLRPVSAIDVTSAGELVFGLNAGRNERVTLDITILDPDLEPWLTERVTVDRGGWNTIRLPVRSAGSVGGITWSEPVWSDPSGIFLDDISIIGVDRSVGSGWALEETFDGDPSSPSQDLLPRDFEYVATHRSHPGYHFAKTYTPFLADHGDDCAGPDPAISPLPQHWVETRQDSTGSDPDESFFICKNHMMSSMGDVEGYSVSSFWPRQEFDFSDGGTLEFEVNINDGHGVRSWWEVMIVPRDQLKVGSGPVDSPISETYPDDRIVFDFRRTARTVKVGTGALAPDGWLVKETERGPWDWAWWRDLYPDDPALDDRRIRRTMRMTFGEDRIDWAIETVDGTFDTWSVDVPGGLPFDRGLVLFKTHAYNPTKDGNVDTYTFHWDNIRFDGPSVGHYDVAEADDVVYLQRNGSRQIGETETVTIDLDRIGDNPVLFGQVHQPLRGQVLVSINGGPDVEVHPYEYEEADCSAQHWKSFRLELDPADLRVGPNTLTWTIGPRPDCATYHWDGYSVKFLQIQTDR